jgi:hypothetical protein
LIDWEMIRWDFWAPNSRHAAVAFRTGRHVMITLLYRI